VGGMLGKGKKINKITKKQPPLTSSKKSREKKIQKLNAKSTIKVGKGGGGGGVGLCVDSGGRVVHRRAS